MPSNLERRLTRLEDRLGDRGPDAEERARKERISLIMAYEQSPAGQEMSRRLSTLARTFIVAVQRPADISCSVEEIAAQLHAADEEAYQRAVAWLAVGAPGAPDWYLAPPEGR